ncbi:hypothetical protein AYI68_g571 [Smittium mucronatum]|uniref:Uncharacterized protein n=1 Tax=Smittium mucronatum TaxID=133383 RepID=A0A1R0H805_9FUNG|nr:hypothetical protein AYI68_g571 [Smittium mucronatum]
MAIGIGMNSKEIVSVTFGVFGMTVAFFIFVSWVFWVVIFGKTNDFTEWGITNESLLRSTTIRSNSSSQLGSFSDKDVRSQSFNIPAVLRAVALYSCIVWT